MNNSHDLFVAVDPFRGLELGFVERGLLDYLSARFPEAVTPRSAGASPDLFMAHLDRRRVCAIPPPWTETRRLLIKLVNRYHSVFVVAAPVGGYPNVRAMLN